MRRNPQGRSEVTTANPALNARSNLNTSSYALYRNILRYNDSPAFAKGYPGNSAWDLDQLVRTRRQIDVAALHTTTPVRNSSLAIATGISGISTRELHQVVRKRRRGGASPSRTVELLLCSTQNTGGLGRTVSDIQAFQFTSGMYVLGPLNRLDDDPTRQFLPSRDAPASVPEIRDRLPG